MRGEQSQGPGTIDGRGTTVRAQLLVQVTDVRADRVRRQGQLAGDLGNREVGGRQRSTRVSLGLSDSGRRAGSSAGDARLLAPALVQDLPDQDLVLVPCRAWRPSSPATG